MDAYYRVLLTHLNTGPDDPVHLLLHLSITALHSVEIKLCNVLALDHARGCPASHAYAVCRPADLCHQHASGRSLLFNMA